MSAPAKCPTKKRPVYSAAKLSAITIRPMNEAEIVAAIPVVMRAMKRALRLGAWR